MTDQFGRQIDYLRLSVTDRCDLRCVYCMTEEGIRTLQYTQILRYEEILRLARIFADLGVKKVRLTGGEPLVRKDLHLLVRGLKEIRGIEQVALTTNGMLLYDQLDTLVDAGLDLVNISIDALDSDVFDRITRRHGVERVRAAIEKALTYPRLRVKLNCVPIGINDSQLLPIALLAKDAPLSVRFIELMPIGPGAGMEGRTEEQVRQILEQSLGPLMPSSASQYGGPCRYYRVEGFRGELGFISAMSHKFCAGCNRIRLTADGFLKTCLQYNVGVQLHPLLCHSDDRLRKVISETVRNKPACHHFSNAVGGQDNRNMYQIGG